VALDPKELAVVTAVYTPAGHSRELQRDSGAVQHALGSARQLQKKLSVLDTWGISNDLMLAGTLSGIGMGLDIAPAFLIARAASRHAGVFDGSLQEATSNRPELTTISNRLTIQARTSSDSQDEVCRLPGSSQFPNQSQSVVVNNCLGSVWPRLVVDLAAIYPPQGRQSTNITGQINQALNSLRAGWYTALRGQ